MTPWSLPQGCASARLRVAERIAYLMAHYDISETMALWDVLDDPDWHDTLCLANRNSDTVPSIQTLRLIFRRSRIEPHADTLVTDGLSPKQLELFNLLKNQMHPHDATYFIQ